MKEVKTLGHILEGNRRKKNLEQGKDLIVIQLQEEISQYFMFTDIQVY